MDLMEQVRAKAAANPQKVAFFEADDPKMMEVVGELTAAGLCECFIVGDGATLRNVAEQVGVDLSKVTVVDITDEEANEAFAVRFESSPDCPFKAKATRRRAKKPMDRCLMMQRIDDVDITFGGLCCSTGEVIIGGQTIIGLADGIDTVSSLGIFNIPGWDGSEGPLLGFGDAAVCAAFQTYHVLVSKCTGCGKCLKACDDKAILGKPKFVHVINQRACSQCGECLEVCPEKAIVRAGAKKPKTPPKPIPVKRK